MSTPTCDDIRALLEDEALNETESAALRAHVATCAACAAYAAELNAQNALMSRALRGRSDDVAFARLKQGLAAKLDAAPIAPRRSMWVRTLKVAASVAALLLVAFLAKDAFWPQNAQPQGDIFTQVAALQNDVRNGQVLDELGELQVALDSTDDKEAKAAAEDAELYLERILALNGRNAEAFRETLRGVKRSGVSSRLRRLRDELAPDSPQPVLASLDLALDAFAKVARIAGEEVADAR